MYFKVLKIFIFFHSVEVYMLDITCRECPEHSIETFCNGTITCPPPADRCYSVVYGDGKLAQKSCVWDGHCTENDICASYPKCKLLCCEGDMCNTGILTTPNIYLVSLIYMTFWGLT